MALLASQNAPSACTTPYSTWTPKVRKIMAFMAIIRGLRLLFYILLGFRYLLKGDSLGGPPPRIIFLLCHYYRVGGPPKGFYLASWLWKCTE